MIHLKRMGVGVLVVGGILAWLACLVGSGTLLTDHQYVLGTILAIAWLTPLAWAVGAGCMDSYP